MPVMSLILYSSMQITNAVTTFLKTTFKTCKPYKIETGRKQRLLLSTDKIVSDNNPHVR